MDIPRDLFGKWFNSDPTTATNQTNTLELESDTATPQLEIDLPSSDTTIATAYWIKMNSVLTVMDQNNPALNRVDCNSITTNNQNPLDLDDLTEEPKKLTSYCLKPELIYQR